MILDKDTVVVGDTLYHLTLGYGTVQTIRDGTARIKMQRGGGIINMGENGTVRGTKVFYWGSPILITPRKNQKANLDIASDVLVATLSLIEERKGEL